MKSAGTFALAAAGLLALGGALAIRSSGDPDATAPLVWSNAEFDVGPFLVGDQPKAASFKIPYRNASGDPVVFQRLRMSCSCMDTEAPTAPAAPGSSGVLAGSLKLAGANANCSHSIGGRIECDYTCNGEACRAVLTLEIACRSPLEADAKQLDVSGDEGGGAAVRLIQFAMADDEAVAEPAVSVRGPLNTAPLGAWGSWEMDGAFRRRTRQYRVAPEAAAGLQSGSGDLAASDRRGGMPLILPVAWRASVRYRLFPTAVVLVPKAPPAVLALECDPGVSAAIEKVLPPAGVTATIAAGASAPGQRVLLALAGDPPSDSEVVTISVVVRCGGRSTTEKVSVLCKRGGS